MSKNFYNKIGIYGYGNAAKDFIKHSQNNFILYDPFNKYLFKNKVESELELFSSSEINIIYVAVPLPFHYEVCKKAIKFKKNVIVEKTATMTSKKWKSLVRLAAKNKVFILENNKIIHSKFLIWLHQEIKHEGQIKYSYLPYIRMSQRPLAKIYSQKKKLDSSFEIGGYPLLLSLLIHNNEYIVTNTYSIMADNSNNIDALSVISIKYKNSLSTIAVSRSIPGFNNTSSIHFENSLIKFQTKNDNYPAVIAKKYTKNGNLISTHDFSQIKSRFGIGISINKFIDIINKNDREIIKKLNDYTTKKISILENTYKS